MAANTRQLSEAFSSHRFTETYAHLADGVRWELDGEGVIEGKDGNISVVSSADVYEFDGHGQVMTITSYAVELDA